MLKETFLALVNKFTDNVSQANGLWTEIEKSYSNKRRYYHNLIHLDNLLIQLFKIKNKLQDWDTILFSLYYHDLIYKITQSDNEEQSALLAAKRMYLIGVPSDKIEKCKLQIIATKTHDQSFESDTNYFTDADLSILGQNWETYSFYSYSVRKEYTLFPDFVYKPGRKKVLNHFLAMNRIFKTEFFYDLFEKQAKQNLQNELYLLNN